MVAKALSLSFAARRARRVVESVKNCRKREENRTNPSINLVREELRSHPLCSSAGVQRNALKSTKNAAKSHTGRRQWRDARSLLELFGRLHVQTVPRLQAQKPAAVCCNRIGVNVCKQSRKFREQLFERLPHRQKLTLRESRRALHTHTHSIAGSSGRLELLPTSDFWLEESDLNRARRSAAASCSHCTANVNTVNRAPNCCTVLSLARSLPKKVKHSLRSECPKLLIFLLFLVSGSSLSFRNRLAD